MSYQEYIDLVSRILIGLNMFIFGLNGFLGFIKLPENEIEMSNFLGALEDSKYLMPTVKIIELVAGAAILLNQYRFQAILILIPIVFNITFSHLFLNKKKGYGIIVLTVIPYLFQLLHYYENFKTILSL